MKATFSRRDLLRAGALATAALAAPADVFGAGKKSVLVFTKSSGFEHDVVKRTNARPSIVENTVPSLGNQYGFDVSATKDGRVFDSKDFHRYAAVLFFTTGDLTRDGTDKNLPMSAQGKRALLAALRSGLGFVGVHAASDTFHTQPDPENGSNRYIAHGEGSDPYLRMLGGGEFISHGSRPRLQTANVIVNDLSFPGLEGVPSPFSFNEEWYSLKDFRTDMHVILTLDTQGMSGKPYERPPYPMTGGAHGRQRARFYTAIGDRPENWSSAVFLNLLGGRIRWTTGDANVSLARNLTQVTPGYRVIPPRSNG